MRSRSFMIGRTTSAYVCGRSGGGMSQWISLATQTRDCRET
jgi:hypothetical protein